MLLTLALLWAFCLNQEKLPLRTDLPVWDSPAELELSSSRSQGDDPIQADSAKFSSSAKGFSAFSRGHFTLLEHSLGEWRFRFELGDYQIEEIEREDGTYSLVHSDDAWLLEQRGKPALPAFRTDFAIPANAVCHLQIISAEQEHVVCAPPLPSPGPLPRQSPPPPAASPEASIYQGTAPFPATLSKLTSTYQLREISGVGVQVTPMQYLPQEGKLLVSRSFEAVLRLQPNGEPNLQLDENASFAFLQQQNFLNGRQLTRAAASTVGTLLLLLPDEWADAVADFVLWKKRVGFKVHTALYPSDTGEGAENIASHIAAYYATHAATHVILCGDWDKIPPWRLSSRAGGEAPYASHNAKITTDAPYALLNGEQDLMADILLSRISADSAGELTALLNKLQLHEHGHADSTWRDKGLFMASGDSYGSFNWDNDFIEGDDNFVQEDHIYIERLRQILLNQKVFSAGDTLYANNIPPAPTSQLVSLSLNSGVSLFYYLGHGNYSSFLTSNFNVNAARNLSNENTLPFVVSPVCHTGNFAITAGDCLSEALLKHPAGGAAAIIAGTGETYWRAPIVLLWKFNDSLLPERAPVPDAGSAALNSIIEGIRYCQSTSDDEKGSQKYFFELMHLFGDSSQTLRLGETKSLQVEQEWCANRLHVRVFRQQEDAQVPVPGARVCLSYGSPELYVSGCSDESGEILLPVNDSLPIYTLRVLEPGSRMWKFQSPQLDNDGNGEISHQELLAWLSEWENNTEKPEAVLAAAIAQWQTSAGSAGSSRGMAATTAPPPVYPPVELRLQIFCQDRQELERLAATGANLTGFEDNIALLECTNAFANSLAQDNFSIVASDPVTPPSTRALDEYPNYEQVRDELLSIAAQYPQLCRMSFVGKSVQNREILALRISLAEAGSAVPELLIAGGLHGDEPPGTEISMRLLKYLCENSEDQEIANLLQNCVLWLIPLMNPDGRELGTRGNANNADLNRDFPDGVILGEEFGRFIDGSSMRLESLQPEQVAIMRWLAARQIAAALHLHTGALKVCYPYGNYLINLNEAISPHDETFHALALHYAEHNSMMTRYHVINAAAWYPVTGELADWQYRFLGTLPLTVELGGPAWNKAPPYSTMETLFAANRPALLGWMEEVRQLYPQGLDWPDCTGQGTWQPKFVFERQQYLPGYDNLARVKFKGLDEATPTALILVTETPADWEISEFPGTLAPLASRKDSERQSAWLFYPGTEGWQSDETLFNLLPPEDSSAEAIFATALHWDGGSGSSPDTHWLPLPERDFAMTWSYGWNAFSLPILIKPSQELPFADLWEWKQNGFLPITETQPGKGYFAFAENSGSFTFNGWTNEENPPPTQSGWNLEGVIWETLVTPEKTIMLQPSGSAAVQVPNRKMQPGKAFWLMQQ